MIRQANAIDFWRGVALVTIFVNHIPNNFYERFTYKNFSISDSAELFVFLAGWSLRLLTGKVSDPRRIEDVMFRVLGRAVTLYVAQMAIALIAIAMLAGAALYLANPLFLEWNNAAALFYDPVRAHIGLVLLSHQLGYFDILPLYVVLMLLVAPIVTIMHRFTPGYVLPLSFAIYLASLVFGLTVRTWPTLGQWFFNPLCWQLIFVLGFTMSRERGPGEWVRRNISTIRIVALPVLFYFLIMQKFNLWWDPTKLPEPRLLFVIGKTFVTPIRLIQFLALLAVMSAAYPIIVRWLPHIVAFCAKLGRNSLPVFCVGSLLSLGGQIVRFAHGDSIVVDTLLVGTGITLLWIVAWLAEWRSNTK